MDHAGVRLCCPDECQQADHPELVRYHANRDVGHPPWDTETTREDGLSTVHTQPWSVCVCVSHRQEAPGSLSSAGCCCSAQSSCRRGTLDHLSWRRAFLMSSDSDWTETEGKRSPKKRDESGHESTE